MLGDLGWWELKARRDKARLKLYKKLNSRKGVDYTSMLVDDIHGVWRQYSDELLQAVELDVDTMKLYSEMDGGTWSPPRCMPGRRGDGAKGHKRKRN